MPLIQLIARSIPTLLSFSAALALSACAFPKVLGDSPLDSSTGGTGGTTSEPGVTDGSPGVCDNPAFTCTEPLDCEKHRCGAIDSPFDASGCLRPSCEDAPCGADEICYSVADSDDCPVVSCADADGACSCQLDDDCTTRFCVPADEGPPVECAKITDEAACAAAGCSEFTTIVGTTIVDGQCVPGEVTPLCMWFPGDAWGGTATPGAFYELATGAATQFPTDWFEPPHGWGDCGDPGAPPACGCFSVCALAQDQAADFLDADKPCADVSDCVQADAVCYDGNTCGSVGVHKDSQSAWQDLHDGLGAFECCAGADPCGATLACENQRCVVAFP